MDHFLGLAALFGLAALLLLVGLTATLVWEARRPPRRTVGYALGRGLPGDPGELDLPFESWTLDRPGAVLPVWDVRPPRPDDERPGARLAAILIHGWGQSRIDMLERIGSCREWADRLVLYDRRGHGEAEGDVSPLGEGEDRDVIELLDRVQVKPVILVGHSMGAVIAIAAAAADADRGRIAGVVAYAPYIDLRASMRGRLRSRGLPAWPFPELARVWLRVRGLRHESTLLAAAALACPLLVIHGARDDVTPAADGRRIAEAAPHGTYIEIASAAHGDAHQADRARHDEALAGFLMQCREPRKRFPDAGVTGTAGTLAT